MAAADQAGAGQADVEIAEDAAHGEGARPAFQIVHFLGGIAAADHGTDRCADDHVRHDAVREQCAHHADMGKAARGASAERQTDGGRVVTAGCGCVVASAARSPLRARANKPSNTKTVSPYPRSLARESPSHERVNPTVRRVLAESCDRNVTGSVRPRHYIKVKCRAERLVPQPPNRVTIASRFGRSRSSGGLAGRPMCTKPAMRSLAARPRTSSTRRS